MIRSKITVDDLGPLLSVALADFDEAGVLLAANAGFLRLLGADATQCIGTRVGRFFVQPDFKTLAGASAAHDGEVHRGLLTIGEYEGKTRTLRGQVWRTPDGLCLLAEHDVEQLEKLGDSLQEMNREAILSQRALGMENIALKGRESRMVEAALTDVLTGVGNRRKLDQSLDVEIARATRGGQPLSALMADIDHFKRVNDVHGHAAGDQVLADFGALLRSQTRPTDIVARFGGEEFVVLMPQTALARGAEVAERIRKVLAGQAIAPLPEPVTSSFGVAEFVPGEEAGAFLKRVDAALYRAKDAGRNTVVLATACGEVAIAHLAWHDRYACGDAHIDAEHKELFRLANEVIDASLGEDLPPETLRLALDQCLDHVVAHFRHEEEILERHSYATLAQHREQHRRLLGRAAALRTAAHAGEAGFGALAGFLAGEVIAKHMLQEDRKFYPLFTTAAP